MPNGIRNNRADQAVAFIAQATLLHRKRAFPQPSAKQAGAVGTFCCGSHCAAEASLALAA
jgi:hypothetical protein